MPILHSVKFILRNLKFAVQLSTLQNLNTTNQVPGPKVIKLEFILKLRIKHNDWLLAETC